MNIICDDCPSSFEWNLMKEAQREKLGQPEGAVKYAQGEQAYMTTKKEEELIKLQNSQNEVINALNSDGGLVSPKLNNELMSVYQENKEEIHNKKEELDDRLVPGQLA